MCDCWGLTTPSLVPDIGIMSSYDIAAIDKASLDMVKYENLIPAGVPEGITLGDTGHLFERLHGKDPYLQIKCLEEIGAGNSEYEIERVV
jgi:uncharacterized Fe-S center protein